MRHSVALFRARFHWCRRSVRIHHAAHEIAVGGVVAIPAEAVWGLSCDPFNESAVNRLLELKQRSVAKGLIITAASPAFFEPLLAALPASEKAEVMASWPGPHTWLVPNRGIYPPWVTGVSDEVAIRVSGSPSLAATSAIAASPLVSTSANPSGAQPARHAFQVKRYFGANLTCSPGDVDTTASPSLIRRVGSREVIRG